MRWLKKVTFSGQIVLTFEPQFLPPLSFEVDLQVYIFDFFPIISHFIVLFRAHSKKAVHLSWPRNKISLYYKIPLCQFSCAYLLFSFRLATIANFVGKT